MNRKTLAILAVLLALAAAFLLRPAGERDAPPAAPDAPPEPTTPRTRPEAPPPEPDTKPPGEASDPAALPPDHVTWEGTVVVIDADGVRHAEEDGEIGLWSSSGGRTLLTSVAVTGGRFRLPAPDEVYWTLNDARIGDRATTHRTLTVLDGHRLAVEMRWPRPLVFRVVSAETGVELTGVTILRFEDWQRSRHDLPPLPAPEEVVAKGAVSPVTVPIQGNDANCSDRVFFVSATGYAWQSVHADTSEGGERLVPLAPGGTIDLRLHGGTREQELRIRLRPEGRVRGEPSLELDPGDGTEFALTGVPAGRWTVRAELGEWYENPEALAETTVDVLAGRPTTATLELPALGPAEPATVSGTLFVHPGWLEDAPKLNLELQGSGRAGLLTNLHLTGSALVPVPGSPGLFRFEAERLMPGDWTALVPDTGFIQGFALAPGGRSEIRIEVPAPASLTLRLTDTSTGGPATVSSVYVSRQLDSGHNSPIDVGDGEGGKYHALAVPGTYSVLVFEDGYEFTSKEVDLGPEGADVEIRLAPAIMLGVTLRDGDTRVPWPEDWGYPELEALGGTGEISGLSFSGGRSEIQFNAPGRYRLTFPAIDGFEPIPPQVVDVRRGGPNELVIRLERKR